MYVKYLIVVVCCGLYSQSSLAGDLSPVIPFSNIIVFCLLLIIAALVYFIYRKVILNKTLNIRAIGHKPFYHYNILTKDEHISASLKHMLGLKESDNTLGFLLNSFIESDQLLLTDVCNKISALSSGEDYSVFDINEVINLKVKEELSPIGVKHVSCQYLVLKNNRNFVDGFFIFFADITSDVAKINHLAYENDALRTDLTSKNNLINSLPFPIWMRNQSLDIIYFNNQFSQIIAVKEGEQSDNAALELDKKSRHLAQLAKDNQMFQQDERHLIVDGQRCLYQFYEVPILATGYMVGVGYDVTSKELIKSELERHVSAQSDLLESTASATAIYRADTRLQFFNQAFVKLWDLDEKWLVTNPTYGQILDKLREKRMLPEQIDFKIFKNEQAKLFTDLISAYNDFFYLPNGKYLRVIVIQHALGGLLFSYEDMTDRLQLERSFKTLSAVQRETIDNLNEGITVFSENGRLELSNPKFLQMWKQDKDFVNSKPHVSDVLDKIKKLFDPSIKWQELKEEFIGKISSRKTSNLSLELKDDSLVDVLFVPLSDGGMLVSYHDVTDSMLVERSLRERNQALREADRIKTEFLANVSYELRSPLTSIIGFSEVLDKMCFGGLNEQQVDYVKAIYSSSQYLMSLINDIIDLASIDAGYLQLELSRFEVYKAIFSIIPLVQERVKEHKLEFEFSCDQKIGVMIGDERRIKQVIFKLLSNAIENSEQKGKIELSIVKDKNGKIVFVIKDEGVGMGVSEAKHIFDKFYRITIPGKSKKYGAGLGLSLVKSFVELHGGEILVKSVKNHGSEFTCVIPAANPELVAVYKEESSKPVSKTLLH